VSNLIGTTVVWHLFPFTGDDRVELHTNDGRARFPPHPGAYSLSVFSTRPPTIWRMCLAWHDG